MVLKIRRLDSTVPLPAYGTDESAGFDLAANHDHVVPPGQIALIRTGLVIEVPAGHFLGIFARSSTPLKRGLLVANGVGVIDHGDPNRHQRPSICTGSELSIHATPPRILEFWG